MGWERRRNQIGNFIKAFKSMKNNIKIEKMNVFEIPVEELFPKFEEHLNIKNNKRILVSGKFGIGKTYFLNEFFKNKKDKYECYHLFPINYQISPNDDIVEFLKYDILVEIIKKDKNIFSDNDYKKFWNFHQLLYFWGKNNFREIFNTGLSLIPKLGRPLRDISGLIENFWQFKKQVEQGEKETINEFIKEIGEKKITEVDYLSEIIKRKIIEQKGSERESVLILDDLDRIDPEHIFRILNVFSAHFDLENKEELPNKFGFDKVIIVADFSNLESIFHHKYGKDTDSSGYFNKFFSVEIFQFKNEEIIAKIMDKLISMFQIEDEYLKGAIAPSGYLRVILENILKKSLKLTGKEKLNMWQLLKGVRFPLLAFKPGNYRKGFIYEGEQAIPHQFIKISIRALISIFDGLDSNFVSVLEKIKRNLKREENKERLYRLFSFSLLKEIKGFEKDINSEGKILWKQYEIKINLEAQEIENVVIRNDKGSLIAPGSLFYDLLIEYINQDLHNKEIGLF